MGDAGQTIKRICVGLLAHVDAGKTTLSEALLYRGGALRKLGRVDHADAFLDTDDQERERGITIFSKQARFPLGNRWVTLLDTPGHVDFSAEAERTLGVLDCAILVVSGADGPQGHTLTSSTAGTGAVPLLYTKPPCSTRQKGRTAPSFPLNVWKRTILPLCPPDMKSKTRRNFL